MVLSRPGGFPEPLPGSFLHVRVPSSGRFFLRRPFSIFDCDKKTLKLLIVEKGEGTFILRRTGVGEEVDFLGPLGGGFPPLSGKRILAVSGGVGLAPLYYYRRYCSEMLGNSDRPADYRLIYGGRTKEDLFLSKIDLSGENVFLATEDGSFGFTGNAAELAETEIAKAPADALFSCGPTPMLKAVADVAARFGVPCWVSLENRMACGVGACRSCAFPVINEVEGDGSSGLDIRYKTVCFDGPVFRADEVDWERLPEP